MKVLQIRCIEPVSNPASRSSVDVCREVRGGRADIPGAKPVTLTLTAEGVLAVGERGVFVPLANIKDMLVEVPEGPGVTPAERKR